MVHGAFAGQWEVALEELWCETSLGWDSQSTACGFFPGSPSAESTAVLAWVGNLTFPSSALVCLNFEIALSGFQQKVLSEQVSSSKCHSLRPSLCFYGAFVTLPVLWSNIFVFKMI